MKKESWKEHFDTKAVTELGYMVKLFGDRPWQDLVPDQRHEFLVDGAGTATRRAVTCSTTTTRRRP